jgi:xanthine dehydrogenase accessory factor
MFLNGLRPPLRMVIVGAVHLAHALVPMARACGYLPIVVVPRSAFASVDRFPQTELVVDWPDAALAQMELDGHTAVVTLTHDPKLDDPALMAAVTSDVFYVGALGSTRTHAARVARLQAAGLSDAQVARIHGPVGLSLGGRDPAEIAVSIMAQITQVLRQS